jgi:toluene monooxygenase system protein E
MTADARWHRDWTAALMRHIADDNTAEAPVPSDPSAVAARITDEVSRELSAALEH